MTLFQKECIQRMRNEGKSYSKIADRLGISENTIKSYCQRNNLGGILVTDQKVTDELQALNLCPNCGKSLEHQPGRKRRKFCSDKCRMTWWNHHNDVVNQESAYHFVCVGCGRSFVSYGNKKRKYCNHECYIKARFMKQSHGEEKT
ncbi:helix-turn-helix domain-containing protein [Desulfosporosinus sp. FKB]|uniref:helix-turn-helix domain-containing protein n=1 Tax=Desulfosporosinus sp. FKB TaxID=1969835 RepID=UPI000B49F6B8|nr:helix-turn-helix domain-containing protein [Desulfosporosinus sp. FKB]